VKGYPRRTKVISAAINVATNEVNAQQSYLSSFVQEDQFKKLIKNLACSCKRCSKSRVTILWIEFLALSMNLEDLIVNTKIDSISAAVGTYAQVSEY